MYSFDGLTQRIRSVGSFDAPMQFNHSMDSSNRLIQSNPDHPVPGPAAQVAGEQRAGDLLHLEHDTVLTRRVVP